MLKSLGSFLDRVRAFEGMPGPRPWFPLGNALDFIGRTDRPWEVLAEYGAEYGGVCVFWTFGEPAVALNDPALIGEVLGARRDAFYKDAPCPELLPVLTRSSPNINNGDDWARTRRATPLSQEWAAAWMRAQAPALLALVRARAAELLGPTERRAVALVPVMQRLVFDAFALGSVGETLPDDAYADFMRVAACGSERMLARGALAPELPDDAREARARWIGLFASRVAAERARPRPDAWDLVASAVRHGGDIPDDELAAELGNTFYGGDFSAPSTLVSTLYLLTHNPGAAARLRDALRGVGDDLPSLLRCEALDQTLREAMRYHPAVAVWGRRVLADAPTTLGGYALPANTKLYLTNWGIHRSAAHWDEPLAFRPARWTPEVVARNPYTGSDAFFPFGRGPRACLGAHYAVFVMKAVLSVLAGPFEVECGRGQRYDDGQTFFFATRTPAGLTARVTRPA